MLLEFGSEPQLTMAIAEWRYGTHQGAEDADTWRQLLELEVHSQPPEIERDVGMGPWGTQP